MIRVKRVIWKERERTCLLIDEDVIDPQDAVVVDSSPEYIDVRVYETETSERIEEHRIQELLLPTLDSLRIAHPFDWCEFVDEIELQNSVAILLGGDVEKSIAIDGD